MTATIHPDMEMQPHHLLVNGPIAVVLHTARGKCVIKGGAYTRYYSKHGKCGAMSHGTGGTERGWIPRLRQYP